MSVTGIKYAVVTRDLKRYCYFMSGSLRFDEKVAKRSAVSDTVEGARRLVARAQAYRDSDIKQYQNHLNINSHYAAHYQRMIDELTDLDFTIVEISVKEVE
ncbi:MAG TPA: hypothetical protein VFM18_16815 [Methanosarcina sp.]|nr:hypothetical protein [Methanosarcina sp.]